MPWTCYDPTPWLDDILEFVACQTVTIRVTYRPPRSILVNAIANLNNAPNAAILQVEQVRHRTPSPSASSEHESANDDLSLGHADSEEFDDLDYVVQYLRQASGAGLPIRFNCVTEPYHFAKGLRDFPLSAN